MIKQVNNLLRWQTVNCMNARQCVYVPFNEHTLVFLSNYHAYFEKTVGGQSSTLDSELSCNSSSKLPYLASSSDVQTAIQHFSKLI